MRGGTHFEYTSWFYIQSWLLSIYMGFLNFFFTKWLQKLYLKINLVFTRCCILVMTNFVNWPLRSQRKKAVNQPALLYSANLLNIDKICSLWYWYMLSLMFPASISMTGLIQDSSPPPSDGVLKCVMCTYQGIPWYILCICLWRGNNTYCYTYSVHDIDIDKT